LWKLPGCISLPLVLRSGGFDNQSNYEDNLMKFTLEETNFSRLEAAISQSSPFRQLEIYWSNLAISNTNQCYTKIYINPLCFQV
jgi:hypothetical protein